MTLSKKLSIFKNSINISKMSKQNDVRKAALSFFRTSNSIFKNIKRFPKLYDIL